MPARDDRRGDLRHPDDVQRASSIVTPLSYLTEVPDAGDVAPTGAEVHAGHCGTAGVAALPRRSYTTRRST